MGGSGGERETYGRTAMRRSSAPAWSGMMTSHSCFVPAEEAIVRRAGWEVGVGVRCFVIWARRTRCIGLSVAWAWEVVHGGSKGVEGIVG